MHSHTASKLAVKGCVILGNHILISFPCTLIVLWNHHALLHVGGKYDFYFTSAPSSRDVWSVIWLKCICHVCVCEHCAPFSSPRVDVNFPFLKLYILWVVEVLQIDKTLHRKGKDSDISILHITNKLCVCKALQTLLVSMTTGHIFVPWFFWCCGNHIHTACDWQADCELFKTAQWNDRWAARKLHRTMPQTKNWVFIKEQMRDNLKISCQVVCYLLFTVKCYKVHHEYMVQQLSNESRHFILKQIYIIFLCI